MSGRSWHHYFHGEGVDMAKVYADANEAMTDYKSPGSSIVHDHPHGVPCDDQPHVVYDHQLVLVTPFVAETAVLQTMRDVREAMKNGEVANKQPMGNGLRRQRNEVP